MRQVMMVCVCVSVVYGACDDGLCLCVLCIGPVIMVCDALHARRGAGAGERLFQSESRTSIYQKSVLRRGGGLIKGVCVCVCVCVCV